MPAGLIALVLLCVLLPVHAEETVVPDTLPDELEDMFQSRWFSIELVLFERLDVLESNTDETLIRSAARSWPQNISQLDSALVPGFLPPPSADVSSDEPSNTLNNNQEIEPESDLESDQADRLRLLPPDGPIQHQIQPEMLVWLDDHTLDLTSLYPMLHVPDTVCLGYPLWPQPDPVSPMLVPPSPAEIAAALELAQLEAEILMAEAAAAPPQPAPEPEETESESAPEDTAQTEISAANGEQDLEESQDESAADALAQTPDNPLDFEFTLAPAPPDPVDEAYAALLDAIAQFEADLHLGQLQTEEELILLDARKAINRRNNLRPLLHQRWTQAVPERGNPVPLILETERDPSAGMTVAGQPKIQGHVALTVSRYLHLAIKLWYHADTLGMSPVMLPADDITSEPSHDYFEFSQSRRMRSEELHYLDHPKLGLIVRVDPIVIPEALQTAFDNTSKLLEERREQRFNGFRSGR